jgi:hypothetical protein
LPLDAHNATALWSNGTTHETGGCAMSYEVSLKTNVVEVIAEADA